MGDVYGGIEYYRGMTLLWILSPVGSLLRWKLSDLNGIAAVGKSWIPWGTFIANMIAVVMAALIVGFDDRYFGGGVGEDLPTSSSSTGTTMTKWVNAILFALKTGVAGSLSTVSTMVKETTLLTESHAGMAKAHYYSSLTCLCGCLLGLCVYAATIRI